MFDAYTVKKVLPRLVAAVILIQLSWFIFTGMIRLTAAFSYGLEGLFYAPFGGIDNLQLEEIFLAAGLGSGAGILGLTAAAAAGVAAAGGIIGLGVLVGLAVFVGFVVLVMRRVLLIGLLLLSPLAIVAWILPGTERIWKMWWDNFSKLLLMFPMIIMLFAAGRVFAYVFSQTISTNGIFEMGVILIAIFGPIAMIPLTYKAAGLGLAAIANAVGGKTDAWASGATERGKKRSKEKWAARKERAGREALFDPTSRLGKTLNKPASWAVAPGANFAYKNRDKKWAGAVPGLRGKGLRVAESIHHKSMEQTAKAYQELNSMGLNDKALRGLSGAWYGFDKSTQDALYEAGLGEYNADGNLMAKKGFGSYKDLQKMQGILAQSGSQTERIAAGAINGALPRLATMFSDPEMGYASVQGAGLIGLASHGFANSTDLASVGNSMIAAGAHAGDVQGILTQAELGAARAGRSDIKAGYGHSFEFDEHGHATVVDSKKSGRDLAWVETMGLADLAGAKGGLLDADMKGGKGTLLKQIVRSAQDPGAQDIARQYKQLERQGLSKQQIIAQHGEDFARTAKMVELAPQVTTALQQTAQRWSQAASGVKVQAAGILTEAGIPVQEIAAPDAIQAQGGAPPDMPEGPAPGEPEGGFT